MQRFLSFSSYTPKSRRARIPDIRRQAADQVSQPFDDVADASRSAILHSTSQRWSLAHGFGLIDSARIYRLREG